MDRLLPPEDFSVLVARAEPRPIADVYNWSIRHPLPTIPIPLRVPDPEIPLNRSELYTIVFDRGRYGRSLNYEPVEVINTLPIPDSESVRIQERTKGPIGNA